MMNNFGEYSNKLRINNYNWYKQNLLVFSELSNEYKINVI